VLLVPVTSAVTGAARHLGHAATTYAVVANGFGGVAGCAAGGVAVLSYTAIGCSLYGLVGSVFATTIGGAWWAWALAAWVVIAGLGGVAVNTNVAVVAVGVVVQLVAVAAVVWSALAHPAEGLNVAGLAPTGLGGAGAAGVGAVLAFGIAAFIGYESPASYVEETRSPRHISRAGHLTLLFLGGCYVLVAWAVGVGYGPHQVIAVSRDPSSGMPLGLLGGYAPIGALVLVVGIGLSLLSFHHLIARYLYRLGVDRVLPARLGAVGSGVRVGAPLVAWWVQAALVLAVIVATAAGGADAATGLFVPASTVGAVGVLAALTWSAWAAGRFFSRGGGDREGWWTRRTAPLLGTACGGAVLAVVAAPAPTRGVRHGRAGSAEGGGPAGPAVG
jgi:amino acid transporter